MYEKYTPVRGRFVSLSDTKYRRFTRFYLWEGEQPRAPLFEAFLDPTGALSERPDIRTTIFRRRNHAPLSQTFTGGEAAA